jgi:hypothetical protein
MPEFPPELKNFVDDAGRLKQWPSKRKLQLAAMPVFAQASHRLVLHRARDQWAAESVSHLWRCGAAPPLLL